MSCCIAEDIMTVLPPTTSSSSSSCCRKEEASTANLRCSDSSEALPHGTVLLKSWHLSSHQEEVGQDEGPPCSSRRKEASGGHDPPSIKVMTQEESDLISNDQGSPGSWHHRCTNNTLINNNASEPSRATNIGVNHSNKNYNKNHNNRKNCVKNTTSDGVSEDVLRKVGHSMSHDSTCGTTTRLNVSSTILSCGSMRWSHLILLLLLLTLGLDHRLVSATERPRYRTTYACEGSTLNMECDPGHVINLIRANYGRFSITICNEHGNTEWSVNCMSSRSHRVLHDKCSQRQNCSVAASTRGFGDPCPGTLKYLEAQFQCVPVNLPHGRPRPVWLVDAQSTVSSITGDQPIKRPPLRPHNPARPDASPDPGLPGPAAPVDLDVVSGIGLSEDDEDTALPDGGSQRTDQTNLKQSDSSTSTTTTLRPPPWLKTNVTKNVTTTTSTSTTTSSTTTTTPAPQHHQQQPSASSKQNSGSSTPAPSVIHKQPSYSGRPHDFEDIEEDEERSLEREEARERQDLIEEQDRLLEEEELSHSYSHPKTQSGPMGDDSAPGTDFFPPDSWCLPSITRGLLWNFTRAGDTAILPCPGGASGWARRVCLPGGWAPRADLGGCLSVWLSTLTARANGTDSVLSVGHDLAAVTAVRALYGGDVTAAARLLSSLVRKMTLSLYNFPDEAQREALLTELLVATLASASNLIGSQEEAWGDLSPAEHRTAATTLLLALEQVTFLLADNLRHQKTVSEALPNILMRLQVQESNNLVHVTFPSPDEVRDIPLPQPGSSAPLEPAASSVINSPPHHSLLSTPSSPSSSSHALLPYDSITLPPEALNENAERGLVKMVFFSYRGLEKLLQPSAQGFYYADDPGYKGMNRTRRLNSRVLAASLGSGRHIELSMPVVITFSLLTTENVSNPACVFWDYTTSSWSEEGCRVVGSNNSHLTCHCDHLTNFAVLMDFHATPLPPQHTFALSLITYGGCVVSIVCLLLSIVVFHFFKGLKNDRTSIHKNLCACLLIAEVVFLGGVNQTDNAVVCGVVAGLLHYFFLASFAWMFMEGLQLYLLLVEEVFESERSRLKWYCMVAYGAPLVIVLVSTAIDPFSYGTPQVCWLNTDNYFIFAFVGPVAAVLLANAVFLTLSLIVLCKHAASSASLKNKEHTKLASIRTWLRGAFVLMFLLGLTWTFGLLYLNQHTVIMAYIFTALNSLQGLFIFIFHCMQNDKKYSFKSCGRDSGHGGSEQDDSPRPTPAQSKLTSLRLNNNVGQPSPGTADHRLVSPFGGPPHHPQDMPSPDALLPDYRLSGSADGIIRLGTTGSAGSVPARLRNQSPYNHTYTEISEGGKSLNGVSLGSSVGGPRHPNDPVYEEIEREGRLAATELQVSDLSDEDGRRVSSDVSRQSSRSYGDHRPLLPYTLPDHLHASLHHLPHHQIHHLQQQLHQHQLHQNHVQQVHMQQQHQLQQQQLQQQLHNHQLQQQQQPFHHHHHHHPMHHHHHTVTSPAHPTSQHQQLLSPTYGEARSRPQVLALPDGGHPSSPGAVNGLLIAASRAEGVVQPLSEPNLRNWEAVQQHRDLQQLQQHLGHHVQQQSGEVGTAQQVPGQGEVTVAVLSGEQVLCKLKSPLAPIQEAGHHLQQSPDVHLQQQQHISNGCVEDHNIQQELKHPVTSLTYSHC